jgi:hypothetical protein
VRTLLVVLVLLASACAAGAPARPATGAAPTAPAEPVAEGSYDVEALPEASGLAASRRNPGVWWMMNDGRNQGVWALGRSGETLGRIALGGFRGRDTEDIAVGACGTQTCVYVADIGDNGLARDEVRIARLAEPDLSAGVPAEPVAADVVVLQYPDGAADAEALFVDAQGTPYIVTKSGDEPRLFAAPGWADGTLLPRGEVPMPPTFGGLFGPLVTAADNRPGRVLLRTYDAVVEFVAPSEDAPLAEFPTWPSEVLPSASEPQSEAIAYLADGSGYATAGEGSPTIWVVHREAG